MTIMAKVLHEAAMSFLAIVAPIPYRIATLVPPALIAFRCAVVLSRAIVMTITISMIVRTRMSAFAPSLFVTVVSTMPIVAVAMTRVNAD